jgi:hypothetical protein
MTPSHTLGATQLSQALAILQKEQQEREQRENTLTHWQRFVFTSLNVLGYGFAITAASIGTILGFAVLFGNLGNPDYAVANAVLCVFVLTTLIFAPITLAAVSVLFSLNLPLVKKIWRNWRLVRKLGLSEALSAPWEEERNKKRFLNFMTLVAGPFIIISGVIFGGLGLFLGYADTGPRNEFWPPYFDELKLWLLSFAPLAALITIPDGLFYLGLHFFRREEERLGVVARLQSTLEQYSSSAETGEVAQVNISEQDYRQIAQIERAQITRDRATSILNFEEHDDTVYFAQKSRTVRHAQAQLDPKTRARVQDQIDALSTEPHPPAATVDSESGKCMVRVPESPFEIGFTVDDKARQITVISLQLTAGDEASNPSHGE